MVAGNHEAPRLEMIEGSGSPTFAPFGIWWTGLLALGLALFMIPAGDSGMALWVSLIGYGAMILAAADVSRRSNDLFNPLLLVLLGGWIRYSVPALIMATRSYDHAGYPLFSVMGLTPESWQLGHGLTITGLVAVALGWYTQREMPTSERTYIHLRPKHPTLAFALFGMGLLSLWLFVRGNAPSLDLVEGGFRQTDIQVGTGKYFFLALALISGSIALTAWLVSLGRGWIVSLMPVVAAGAAYFLLGGRARAATPLAAGVLILWHRHREAIRVGSQVRRFLLMGMVIAFLAAWFGNFGAIFRAGGGIGSLSSSLSSTATYLESGALIDFGHLHAVAGAYLLEPATLGSPPFSYSLSWPVSDVLGLPGPSPGTYVIRSLTGDPDPGWGLHTGLIGDAYLSFGLLGVIAVTGVFGAGLKYLYTQFQRGRVPVALHAVVVVYSVRLFLEGIAKWPEALVVALFLVIPFGAGSILRGSIRSIPPRAERDPYSLTT